MNVWNHELPKGSEIRCSSISCPTCGTRHDLRQITENQSYVTVSEQHMWLRGVKFVWTRSVGRPYNFRKVVWRFREEYPCFNNFETRIYPLNRKSSYFEQTRAYRMNCETKTPFAGDSGILLRKYGKLTKWKLCEKFTILIKLQMVKIISPFWSICSLWSQVPSDK